MLPGRRDLAKEYGVDLMTLQRAIARLLDDETLVASGRRGTFVNAARAGAEPGTAIHAPRPTKPLNIGVIGVSVDDYTRIDPFARYFNHSFLSTFESSLRNERDVDFAFVSRSVPRGAPPVSIENAVDMLDVAGLDAIVILFADTIGDFDSLARLKMSLSIPMLVTSSRQIEVPVPQIYYDSFAAGFDAALHLIQVGAREIVVAAPFNNFWVRERLAGIEKAVQHAGLPADALYVWTGPEPGSTDDIDQLEAGKIAGTALFAERPNATAIIAINDFVAMGLASVSRKSGRLAGKHYLLIGFDDLPQAAMAGISSMRPPLETIGREAAKMIVNLIEGEADVLQIRLKSNLIVRSSMREAIFAHDNH